MAALDWASWDDDPLTRAGDEDKIVLLFLGPAWCRFTREMCESTFRDPKIIRAVQQDFVPVLVDADRRPDLDSRYNMGGWPTVSFVSPEGELIAGENFMTAQELLPLLGKVCSYYRKHREDIAAGIEIQWKPGRIAEREEPTLDPDLADEVIASMLEKFDHRFGGWGSTQKFAHPESLDFALVQYSRTSDERMSEVVRLTLTNMMEGGIHDSIEGGFFRYSTTPDWRVPHYEKVLDNNALRLSCFTEAYQVFGDKGYKKAAEGIVDWMLTIMRDPETGALCGSQGDSEAYFGKDAEGRKRVESPILDKTIYTNWNAMAIFSLLKASVVLERPEIREQAMEILGFLMDRLYSEREGMYHYWDGTYHLPGFLSDQAYMIRTLIAASQCAGDADLLLPAERLADLLLEKHRAPGGGFYDLPESGHNRGALRKRNRSILENSVLAEALTRLAYLSHSAKYRTVAEETLLAFSNDYREYGYFVAGYARAVDLFLKDPVVVTIVGDRDSSLAQALRGAAQRSYVASRIVQTLDPAHDPVLLERSGLEPTERAKAWLSRGQDRLGSFEDPDELAKRMGEAI